jgi:hypothetical protein
LSARDADAARTRSDGSAAVGMATVAGCWIEKAMDMDGGQVDRKGVIGASRRRLAQMIND